MLDDKDLTKVFDAVETIYPGMCDFMADYLESIDPAKIIHKVKSMLDNVEVDFRLQALNKGYIIGDDVARAMRLAVARIFIDEITKQCSQ